MSSSDHQGPPEDRRVYRPVGPAVVGVVAALCLWVMFFAIAFSLPAEARAGFTWPQTATLVLMLLLADFGLWGMARSRVVADDDGVHVRNGYRNHHLAWSDLVDVAYGPGSPWPSLETKDDRRIMMMGIPSSDGPKARDAVWYLRERIIAGGGGTPTGAA